MRTESVVDSNNHRAAYFYRLNSQIKELPELERKLIENMPGEGNLYPGLLYDDEEPSKTVYEHGIRRRLESGNSTSPLLRKSQMKKHTKNDRIKDDIDKIKQHNFIIPQDDSDFTSKLYNQKEVNK